MIIKGCSYYKIPLLRQESNGINHLYVKKNANLKLFLT